MKPGVSFTQFKLITSVWILCKSTDPSPLIHEFWVTRQVGQTRKLALNFDHFDPLRRAYLKKIECYV
jgi:hypothetical protein